VLAWLRRIIVSFGVGGTSYALMLAFMVASVVYDRELEPVVTFAFETGRQIIDLLEALVSGTYWGQVAVNHLRERVNMTHVVLSIPAIIIAVILVGIPLNRLLGGTRSSLQRVAIAIVSIPATLALAVTLFILQRARPGNLCSVIAVRGLDLASIPKRAERLGRYDPGSAQIDECCPFRVGQDLFREVPTAARVRNRA
jgi:hypothetical protein